MSQRTPLGFYVASIIAAGFGLMMVAWMVSMDSGPFYRWTTVAGRVGSALLAALALVAVEALWCARRWAYRATLALVAGYAALIVTVSVVGTGFTGLFLAFWLLLVSAMVLVPIVLYVRDRSAVLFGPPHAPQPAPQRPVPAPTAPGRRPPPWW
ncbi:MAG TPA: hypothetical protein VFJ16_14475 [Longimicrobium sp.]|nr:hypothetical protein [Longimicrobium sp.]